MLEGKAYKFIKQGLELMHKNPNNISIQKWPTKEDILKELTIYYKVFNTTQVIKNKLNYFPQGKYNYQSQKGEFNKLIVLTKKIDEQKVDLFQKFISPKMGELVLRLAYKINNNNYMG